MISEEELKDYESWGPDYHKHWPHYRELITEIRRLQGELRKAHRSPASCTEWLCQDCFDSIGS